MKRALFLDRDGVLNVDTGYIGDPDRLMLVSGVVPFLQRATELGYLLVIVTNQSGIARGYFSEEDYSAVTERLRFMFAEHGINFAGIYRCPHHPEGKGPLAIDCSCRKPLPGLILQAGDELDIDLEQSIMVGDKQSDIDAAVAAGVRRQFLLRHSPRAEEVGGPDPFVEIKDHLEATNGCAMSDHRTAEPVTHPDHWRRSK